MCNEDAGSHYCTVTVQPPGAIMRVRWGVCVPKGFTAQDITNAVWAFATADQMNAPLCAALSKVKMFYR